MSDRGAVSHCVRIGPLVMLALLAMKGRWLLGLLTGPGPRGAAAASTTGLSRLAATGGAVVSQAFLWMFALIALGLLGGLVSMVVGELRLRREFRGGAAGRRAERARARAESPWYR